MHVIILLLTILQRFLDINSWNFLLYLLKLPLTSLQYFQTDTYKHKILRNECYRSVKKISKLFKMSGFISINVVPSTGSQWTSSGINSRHGMGHNCFLLDFVNILLSWWFDKKSTICLPTVSTTISDRPLTGIVVR